MWAAEMPAYSAACLFWPTVVMRNPIVVRAMQEPHDDGDARRRGRSRAAVPRPSGISADGWISGVREMRPGLGVVERPAGADEVLGHVDEDGVEHDRRDHLVRPPVGLEDAGERRRQHAEDPADEQGEAARAARLGRPVKSVADPRRERGAEEQLALGADVEQAGLQCRR